MWKYVSRRIKDTFERGAGYFDARSAATAGTGVARDKPERPPAAVPSRWLCERRCWSGRAHGDGAHHNSYFNYLNQSWLGAITWSSALCLGWYASQLIHLKKKYHSREPSPICSIAAQLQRNLTAAQLFCCKPLKAISDDEAKENKEKTEVEAKHSAPVHLVTNEQGSEAASNSSHSHDLSDILNSIENKLGLAAIENGHHQDGLGMLRSAANRHHPPALYNLGLCYEIGLGVKPDEKMAMELYRTAASFEHPGALYNLAVYYGQGRGGLPRDPDTALRLLRLAAHKGQSDAMDALKSLEPQEEPWLNQEWKERESWSSGFDVVPSQTSLFVEQINALRSNDIKCHAAVY